MSSIVKNKDVGFLDVRVKPEWELLDLKEETGDYEHELFSSVVSEFDDISGFPVEIYLMNPKNVDHVYGESQIKGYDGPYRTKILYSIDNTEQSILETFGFSADSRIEYAEIPKAVWQRDVVGQLNMKEDIDYPTDERYPMPQDLIKTLWDNSVYEITHVNGDVKVFSAEKLVWSIKMTPYRYSHESSEAKDMIYEELDLDDFPEVNKTWDTPTLEDHLTETEIVKKESHENDEYSDVDTSVYGY